MQPHQPRENGNTRYPTAHRCTAFPHARFAGRAAQTSTPETDTAPPAPLEQGNAWANRPTIRAEPPNLTTARADRSQPAGDMAARASRAGKVDRRPRSRPGSCTPQARKIGAGQSSRGQYDPTFDTAQKLLCYVDKSRVPYRNASTPERAHAPRARKTNHHVLARIQPKSKPRSPCHPASCPRPSENFLHFELV